ncbi:MAG: hypothetical protein WCS96_10440 [Victivallales bacterium]
MSEYSYTPEGGLTIKTGVRFSRIYLIESLGENEFHSGRRLYEDVLKKQQLALGWLDVIYKEISTATDMFDLLEEIASDIQVSREIPLLHIETHGTQNCIELASGEKVQFTDLLDDFRKINILACNNLFVIAAACHGAHLVTALSLTEESPFWGVCGSSDEVNGKCLLEGYKAFYEECFKSRDILKGLDCLTNVGKSHGVDFRLWTSEYLFLLVFRKYLHSFCNEEQIEESVKRLRAMAKAQCGDYIDTPERAEMVRKRLGSVGGQKESFELMKAKFFMYEQCPGNRTLFNPGFEDMLR